MAFRGLFIGIDRYMSPDINELSCARRDAVALEALFSDTLREVAARCSDMVPVAARVAEILYPTLDLNRVGWLVLRLIYGVPAAVTDLAREAGADLLRGEYGALVQAGLGEPSSIGGADDATLLRAVGGDSGKLSLVRVGRTARRSSCRDGRGVDTCSSSIRSVTGPSAPRPRCEGTTLG